MQLTASGTYLSGMTILSGAPNKLSIALVLSLPPATSFLFKADLITSGVLKPLGPSACSISRSSLDLAES